MVQAEQKPFDSTKSYSFDRSKACQVACQSFVNKNVVQTNEEFSNWLRDSNMKRDQIISITSHESSVEEGLQVVVVFYRTDTVHRNPLPVDNITLLHGKHGHDWDTHTQTANTFFGANATADIIGCTRTATNYPEAQLQYIWYSNESNKVSVNTPSIKEFTNANGDVVEALKEASLWLNAYVAPHQIVSLMTHEDSHPNNEPGEVKTVRVLIVHTAGSNPKQLVNTPAKDKLPAGGFFSLNVIGGDSSRSWDERYQQAVDKLNSLNHDGYVVSASNVTEGDSGVIAIFSWNTLEESSMEEILRPTGCGVCSIF